jgi:hypothetical protein
MMTNTFPNLKRDKMSEMHSPPLPLQRRGTHVISLFGGVPDRTGWFLALPMEG